MLTKVLLFSLIFLGALVAVLFDSPRLDVESLHKLGIASVVLGFLLVPFYHILTPQKSERPRRLPGVLAALGSSLVVVAAATYLMEFNSVIICHEGLECLWPFFFITLPSIVLGLLMLLISVIVHK